MTPVAALAFSSALALIGGAAIFKLGIPFAESRGWVDHPTSRRRHPKAMPVTGGLFLFATWILALGAYCLLSPSGVAGYASTLVPLIIGIACFAGLGLRDDLKGLAPGIKLAIEFAIAVSTLLLVPPLRAFCASWEPVLGLAIWPLAAIWLVGVSNAVNLIDGLDGLAGGVSLIVASSLALIDLPAGGAPHILFVLVVLLACSIAGFLRFNWYPARIFMGDNGTLPLGYLLGSLLLASAHAKSEGPSVTWAMALVLMMGYPILDMGLCVVRRFRTRNPIFKADRNHLHHRFLRLGVGVPQAVGIALCLAAYLQLMAFALTGGFEHAKAPIKTAALILAAVALTFVCVLYMLRMIELNRLSALAVRDTPKSLAQFRECWVLTISLVPLYESGLFEERSRVRDLVVALKLLCERSVRTSDSVYVTDKNIHIILGNPDLESSQCELVEARLKKNLDAFQQLFDIQYSLSSLTFEREKRDLFFEFAQSEQRIAL